MNDLSLANLSIFVKFTNRQTFVDKVWWYVLLCQSRPIYQSQGQENGFYLRKSRQKTKFVKSRCLELIIIYCHDTGYHSIIYNQNKFRDIRKTHSKISDNTKLSNYIAQQLDEYQIK
ncbi:Hypothetical_protein [Hexamita inflata]|uniref:Hypothetical_protein n=1 Tax=Hexamita inflata TaxID=28002 RepID=A0AA86R1X4_9EUKA|nr:Hypothetical protein HINF_LOCUS52028 [Hexamita inflata]